MSEHTKDDHEVDADDEHSHANAVRNPESVKSVEELTRIIRTRAQMLLAPKQGGTTTVGESPITKQRAEELAMEFMMRQSEKAQAQRLVLQLNAKTLTDDSAGEKLQDAERKLQNARVKLDNAERAIAYEVGENAGSGPVLFADNGVRAVKSGIRMMVNGVRRHPVLTTTTTAMSAYGLNSVVSVSSIAPYAKALVEVAKSVQVSQPWITGVGAVLGGGMAGYIGGSLLGRLVDVGAKKYLGRSIGAKKWMKYLGAGIGGFASASVMGIAASSVLWTGGSTLGVMMGLKAIVGWARRGHKRFDEQTIVKEVAQYNEKSKERMERDGMAKQAARLVAVFMQAGGIADDSRLSHLEDLQTDLQNNDIPISEIRESWESVKTEMKSLITSVREAKKAKSPGKKEADKLYKEYEAMEEAWSALSSSPPQSAPLKRTLLHLKQVLENAKSDDPRRSMDTVRKIFEEAEKKFNEEVEASLSKSKEKEDIAALADEVNTVHAAIEQSVADAKLNNDALWKSPASYAARRAIIAAQKKAEGLKNRSPRVPDVQVAKAMLREIEQQQDFINEKLDEAADSVQRVDDAILSLEQHLNAAGATDDLAALTALPRSFRQLKDGVEKQLREAKDARNRNATQELTAIWDVNKTTIEDARTDISAYMACLKASSSLGAGRMLAALDREFSAAFKHPTGPDFDEAKIESLLRHTDKSMEDVTAECMRPFADGLMKLKSALGQGAPGALDALIARCARPEAIPSEAEMRAAVSPYRKAGVP